MTGSPFAKVEHKGKTYEPGQGNNMCVFFSLKLRAFFVAGCILIFCQCRYVFPGIGLGAIIAEVKNISDAMIETSAIALSEALDDDEKADELLYPRLNR